jgi:hypothetical protein
MSNTFPYWIVKDSHGSYIRACSSPHLYGSAMAERTNEKSQAAHFGRDFAKVVASSHKGKVIKITGAKPKVARNVHLALVIDSSGSMASIQLEAKNAFNGIFESTRAAARSNNIRTKCSMWEFGVFAHSYAPGSDIAERFFGADIERARLVDYRPYGQTPLFDAVGTAICKLKESATDPSTSYLVQIVTDGAENTSRKYGARDINRLITSCQAEGNWTFVFHMPPGSKKQFVALYGVPEANCREWEGTARGVMELANVVGASTQGYYGSVTRGAKATTGFFTADLNKVKASDVKRAMVDVSGALKSYVVPREMAIKEFVEDVAKQAYRIGDTFYQLSKAESIQPDKKILVKEKGKSAIYYGDDARAVLGLPPATPNSILKIKPGNLAQWDLFVNSHSVNRKLVRGTSVLVLKPGEVL